MPVIIRRELIEKISLQMFKSFYLFTENDVQNQKRKCNWSSTMHIYLDLYYHPLFFYKYLNIVPMNTTIITLPTLSSYDAREIMIQKVTLELWMYGECPLRHSTYLAPFKVQWPYASSPISSCFHLEKEIKDLRKYCSLPEYFQKQMLGTFSLRSLQGKITKRFIISTVAYPNSWDITLASKLPRTCSAFSPSKMELCIFGF